ncbi:MAG: OmpA family protein, partial [Myxococcota bacterium]
GQPPPAAAAPQQPVTNSTPLPNAPQPVVEGEERKLGTVELVGTGSKAAKKGKSVGMEGRSEGYQDTRVSDRSPNIYGQTGLRRMTSARVGAPGYFDLSLHGRAFYTAEPPKQVPGHETLFRLSGGPFITNCRKYGNGKRDCDQYTAGYMWGGAAFGVTIFDIAEVSVAGYGSGIENSEINPRVLFSTGNVAASLKLGLPIVVWTRKLPDLLQLEAPLDLLFPIPIAFALDTRLYLPSRSNALGSQVDNFYLAPTGAFTFDLFEKKKWPFRAHLNAGYVFQSPWSIEKSLEQGTIARDPNRILKNAEGHAAAVGLDYTYFDRIAYGAGVEFPLPFVTPFLELTGEVPVPVPWKEAPGRYVGSTVLINTRSVMTNPLTWPSRVTPGLRITPGRGLAFDLAFDVALGGRGVLVEGMATQVPWAVFGGLSYNFSPFVAETQVELREVEKEVIIKREVASVRAGGKIGGHIYDAVTGQPIPEARIAFPATGGPRILTDAAGAYESYSMDPNTYEVIVEAVDYAPNKALAVVKAGELTTVDLRLTPQPRAAAFKATIVNDKDESVPAKIILTEARGNVVELDAQDGTVTADVPPGKYKAVARAEGYLLIGKNVVVEAGSRTAEVFLLKPEPRKRLTVLTKERIEIKSTIHFEYNKARLLSSSSFLLDEVVDTLLKNPQIERIRIEGHTDNTGAADYNQQLSQARAEAVREYLISNGVAESRVEAVGYGDARPLAPNTTEAGRARNRRVEFVIIAGEAGSSSESTPPPAPANP